MIHWTPTGEMRHRISIAALPSSSLLYRVNMRWFDGLTAQHLITWGSKTLNVDGEPKDLGGINREHELMCVEAG
jgi:hypothetical protein